MFPQHDLDPFDARRRELEAEAAQHRHAKTHPRARSRRWAARKVPDLRLGANEYAPTLGCTDLARLMP